MIRSMIRYAIQEVFPEAVVYEEQVTQIERPAFYISEIKVSQDKSIGNRYYRYHSMVVRYFPVEDSPNTYTDLDSIADNLYACLEYLDYGGQKGRSIRMNHRVEDQVLQFYFTVQLALKRPENNAKMEHIETEEKLKE